MSISGLSLIIEFSETGNWAFENDKMQVNLTGVGSIELTNQLAPFRPHTVNLFIFRLDNFISRDGSLNVSLYSDKLQF